MSEQPKGFTVNDRRHFAPDGSPRNAGAEAAPGALAGASVPPPTPPATSAAEAVDFASFLLSLGAQASLLLGGAAEEGEAPREADLPGARQIISILEMLQEKTEGRRTDDESRLLEGLLYELRMAWVARSRSRAS